jgi:hypothetical protein
LTSTELRITGHDPDRGSNFLSAIGVGGIPRILSDEELSRYRKLLLEP